MTDNVTQRVDARLVQGNYKDYAQIASEEGTTEGLVAKRAHILKKEGRLDGDRRSAKAKGLASTDAAVKASTHEEITPEKKLAYRMLGVSEKDIEIMEALQVNPAGLRKVREDLRALRHDKLAEQVARDFPGISGLNEFKEFYTAVRKTGVHRSEYEHVMSKVGETMSLDGYLTELKGKTEEREKYFDSLNRLGHEQTKKLEEADKKHKALVEANRALETKKNTLLQDFQDIADGNKYSDEIMQLISKHYEMKLKSDRRWRDLVQCIAFAASKFPTEFEQLKQAIQERKFEHINANHARLGLPLLEAENLYRRVLEQEALEDFREKLIDFVNRQANEAARHYP